MPGFQVWVRRRLEVLCTRRGKGWGEETQVLDLACAKYEMVSHLRVWYILCTKVKILLLTLIIINIRLF